MNEDLLSTNGGNKDELDLTSKNSRQTSKTIRKVVGTEAKEVLVSQIVIELSGWGSWAWFYWDKEERKHTNKNKKNEREKIYM